MPETLKPCPFCGCKEISIDRNHARRWIIGCDKPSCHVNLSVYGYTRAEAIAAWNKRQDDAVIEAAQKLVNGMETCHDCGGAILVDEGPVYCESGCASDCDVHQADENPDPCPTIYGLHATLKRALAALLKESPK